MRVLRRMWDRVFNPPPAPLMTEEEAARLERRLGLHEVDNQFFQGACLRCDGDVFLSREPDHTLYPGGIKICAKCAIDVLCISGKISTDDRDLAMYDRWAEFLTVCCFSHDWRDESNCSMSGCRHMRWRWEAQRLWRHAPLLEEDRNAMRRN